MLLDKLKQDVTFFITAGGEVYTFHSKDTNAHGNEDILVYDRTSITGLRVLDINNIVSVISAKSKETKDRLKFFNRFMENELKNRPTLFQYIVGIQYGHTDSVDELYEEDCTLPEQFGEYMEQLIERKAFNESIVRYFNAVFFEQEVIYPKYSKQWLDRHQAC